jgi:hypothetical protein
VGGRNTGRGSPDAGRISLALKEAVRELTLKLGHSPLYRVVEVDPLSRIPERRHALLPIEPWPMEHDLRLRPLDSPTPVGVCTDREGRPTEVRIPGGREGRKVAAVREVWRIDDEWWRRPISRLYHEVALENGKLLTLYLDLEDGGWWKQ